MLFQAFQEDSAPKQGAAAAIAAALAVIPYCMARAVDALTPRADPSNFERESHGSSGGDDPRTAALISALGKQTGE